MTVSPTVMIILWKHKNEKATVLCVLTTERRKIIKNGEEAKNRKLKFRSMIAEAYAEITHARTHRGICKMW